MIVANFVGIDRVVDSPALFTEYAFCKKCFLSSRDPKIDILLQSQLRCFPILHIFEEYIYIESILHIFESVFILKKEKRVTAIFCSHF